MESQEDTSHPIAVIKIHDQFNAADSDVTFQSSDGALFLIHRKNLEAITGAFPGPEFSTGGEIVPLTEPAKVLEIMFQFIYPRRHPTLENLNFELVLAVAEAVEKYEIFSAMKTCEVQLSRYAISQSERVFLHGVRHHCPSLMDKAARNLLSRKTASKISQQLPFNFVMPWLEYQNAWRLAFESVVEEINDSHDSSDESCFEYYKDNETKDAYVLCRICRAYCLAWVSDLESIDRLMELDNAAEELKPHEECEDALEPLLCEGCRRGNYCQALPMFAEKLRDAFELVPPFTQFLRKPET